MVTVLRSHRLECILTGIFLISGIPVPNLTLQRERGFRPQICPEALPPAKTFLGKKFYKKLSIKRPKTHRQHPLQDAWNLERRFKRSCIFVHFLSESSTPFSAHMRRRRSNCQLRSLMMPASALLEWAAAALIAYAAAPKAWVVTCGVPIACPAERAAAIASASFASRAAAWAASEALRTSAILNTPVAAHARHASMAFRGRSSSGCFFSKYGSTCSAQSAAQMASIFCSLFQPRCPVSAETGLPRSSAADLRISETIAGSFSFSAIARCMIINGATS